MSKYTNFPIKSDAKIERVCLFRKETAVNDIKLIFFNAESKTLYNQHLLCSIYASFKRVAPSNEDTITFLQTIKVSFFCKSTTFQSIFHYMGGKNVNKITNEPFSTIMKKHFVSLLSKTHRFIIQRFESKIKDCYILVSYEQSIPIVVFHCFSTIGECMLPNI